MSATPSFAPRHRARFDVAQITQDTLYLSRTLAVVAVRPFSTAGEEEDRLGRRIEQFLNQT